MTKTELLAQASSRYYTNQDALAMAKAALSADQASERAALIGRRIRAVDKAFYASGIAANLAIVCAAILHMLESKVSLHEMGAVVFLVIIFMVVSWIPVTAITCIVKACWANADVKQMLEPIAGTGQCETALRNLTEGGDKVREWRDIAIAERGQLHGFDCHLMESLRYRHAEIVELAKWQAKQDAACKTVHGVSESTDSAELGVPAQA